MGEKYLNISEKEKRQKMAQDKYLILSEEEKEKCQYYHERNKNLPEEQKQNQVEYMRNYCLTHKK